MASQTTTPGDHIRSTRKRLGLTLADLSSRTGLAVSTLSKLEKGNVSLSYDKLMLLSKGLNVDMAELLTDTQAPRGTPPGGGGRRVVQRVGEGQSVQTRSYDQMYLAAELLNKRFTPMVVEVHARTLAEFKDEFGDFIRHPGEEFAYVLEGEIEFNSELYAPVVLRAGDSIYFDSEMGHAYLKAADGPCRLVASCAQRQGAGEPQLPQTFREASQRLAEPVASKPAARRAAPPAPPATSTASARAAKPLQPVKPAGRRR